MRRLDGQRLDQQRLDGEQWADRIVHAFGLVGGLAGGATLVVTAARSAVAGQLVPVLAYVAGLLAMLGCSAAYHLWNAHRHREWLRRLDHAAIFMMIAGTYTPIAILALRSPWDSALTAAAWIAAAAGAVVKLVRPRRIESISIALYLLLGWMGVLAAGELIRSVAPLPLLMILAGGLVYSGGVVFHLSSRRYHLALWHASVLLGATLHFAAIASLVQS
jgi:hemolysin III